MSDPHEIWQLAQWIARQEGGAARLGWSDGELILRVHRGRIRFVEGIDGSALCRRLSCESAGNADLLEEARALASDRQIAETYAMSAAKELVQAGLKEWLLDPQRELEIVEGEPNDVEGATISITHALVELVLSDTSGATASAIVPDIDVLLARSPDFLDLYAPLRLSEEADLIVSKITGERTVREVADRSDHGADEVMRLLAALVVTGILEPEPALIIDGDVDLLPAEDQLEKRQRRLPPSWTLAAAAVLVIALAIIAWVVMKPAKADSPATGVALEVGAWSVVVDMGCEPQDLQRVLKKAQQHPEELRPVAAESVDGGQCWRLVWGQFGNSEAASAAIGRIPDQLRQEGFDPHVIELTGDEMEPPQSSGD